MEGLRARADGGGEDRPAEGQLVLRFLVCGSDAGKSRLLDRLAAHLKPVAEARHTERHPHRTSDERPQATSAPAPATRGVFAELGQDTSGVAYRTFSTGRRALIAVDVPSQASHIRNLLAEAAHADAVVVLVDARAGLTGETRNQAFLLALAGARNVVVAVIDIDLCASPQQRFADLGEELRSFATATGLAQPVVVPASVATGDNIAVPSEHLAWYRGPALLDCLESIEVDDARRLQEPFRLRVERVDKIDATVCEVRGTVLAGAIGSGDGIRILPSGRSGVVQALSPAGSAKSAAPAGRPIVLRLGEAVEVGEGDVVASSDSPPEVAAQFEATVVWMDEEPLLRGRTYLLKSATRQTSATVSPVKYKVNMTTLEHVATEKLGCNDVGVCELELSEPIVFDPYTRLRETGWFSLIDPIRRHTVGAGVLHFALRRAHNIHAQALDVDKAARAGAKGQKPCVLWLTGLSGSGKSTIANLVDKRLHAAGYHTYVLDGDNVRHGLNKDLGFTAEDRVENIWRIAEVAKLMVDAGLIVLTAFISPFRAERRMARSILQPGEFIEVFVDTPLAVAEQRDPKGLYRKARRGEIKNFTGIDSPYEAPEAADIRIDTSMLSAQEAAEAIIGLLQRSGVIGSAHACSDLLKPAVDGFTGSARRLP